MKQLLDSLTFEETDWQSSLAKTLVLDYDVKASAAEIAACCLWHTSFYGFYPENRKEFGRTFRANHGSIHRCDTFAYDVLSRLAYFRELVKHYGLLQEEMCLANSFVCISASPEHPLTMPEISEAESPVTSGHGGEHRIVIKSDVSLGEELRVDIAYYE